MEKIFTCANPEAEQETNATDNRLYYGDCLTILPQLQQIVGNNLSCVFISPPFNSEFTCSHYENQFDKDYFLSFMQQTLTLLFRLMNQKGILWVHLDEHYSHYIKIILDEIFGQHHYLTELIYHCPDRMTHYNYTPFYPQCERILVYCKGEKQEARHKFFEYMQNNTGFLSDLWTRNSLNLENEGDINFIGGKMPESILKTIIELSSNPGEYILDCFAGSGTTGRVAQKLDRQWILIEKNKETVDKLCVSFKKVLNGQIPYGVDSRTNSKQGWAFSLYSD